MTIRLDLGLLLAVYGALFAFGIGYNWLVGWIEQKHYDDGYMSLIVSAGVIITVGLTTILIGEQVLIVFGAFIASGTPMILGSMYRHAKAREAAQNAIRAIHNDQAA